MDYGKIVYDCNTAECKGCHIRLGEITWCQGEITEIELPIYGGFTLDDNTFISISDFMGYSPTKSVKMVLKDRYGDEVNVQEVRADSSDLEYYDDRISCYFIVDEELSKVLTSGSYFLYIYIQNVIDDHRNSPKKRTVFNETATGPDGLKIIIS